MKSDFAAHGTSLVLKGEQNIDCSQLLFNVALNTKILSYSRQVFGFRLQMFCRRRISLVKKVDHFRTKGRCNLGTPTLESTLGPVICDFGVKNPRSLQQNSH